MEEGMTIDEEEDDDEKDEADGKFAPLTTTQVDDEESAIDDNVHNEKQIISKTVTNASQGGALAKTLSLVRTRESSKDVGPPPDGGFRAWTQIALAHLVTFNTWGYISSFGVFQTYYTETLGHSPSDISWVGSIQISLLFLIGTFSGRATDAGFFKVTVVIGSFLQVFGICMTSLCTKYWQLFVAQGVVQGIGCGLMFCPTIALAPTYFSKKRSFAMGVVACGSATGGLVFPAVVMRLLPRIGYGWTMRTLALIVLVTLIPCLLFLKQRLPPRKTGPIVEWTAFKEMPYCLYAVSMFLIFWGIYVGYFYIGSFGRNVIGVSQSTSIDLLMVMNGVGIPARLILSFCADRYTGPLHILLISSFATGVIAYGWSGVKSLSGLYIFAVVYGIAAAGIQALFPATLSSLTTDLKRTGVRMGMVFSVVGVAALIGSPIAGALVQKDHGQYLYAQMFMSSCIIAGTLNLVGVRAAKLGFRLGRM